MKINYMFVFCLVFLLFSCKNDPLREPGNKEGQPQKKNDVEEYFGSSEKQGHETILVQADQKGNLVFLAGKTEKGYEKMFVVQMENPATIEKMSLEGTINKNEKNISVYTAQGLTYIYTIDQKAIENESENVIVKKSYGISEHEGMFEIVEHTERPSHIYDVLINHTVSDETVSRLIYLTHINEIEGGGNGGLDCTSGGKGSTECSITGPFNGCSVSCSPGYYACCDDSIVVCKCLKKEKN